MKGDNFLLKLFFILIILMPDIVLSQVNDGKIEKYGKITSQSSDRIEVKYENTEGIKLGDTLYVRRNKVLIPVVIVNNVTATACSGKDTGIMNLNEADTIIALVNAKFEENDKSPIVKSIGSEKQIEKYGKITFQSSQNVYVKFEDTEGIEPGDTLFVKKNKKLVPVIIVKYKSASSCSGENTGLINLKTDDTIIALVDEKAEEMNQLALVKPIMVDSLALRNQGKSIDSLNLRKPSFDNNKKYVPNKNYYGRFSVQSISSMDNTGSAGDLQRWRYSFSFNKNDFLDSKLSFSNYIVFAYSADQWSDVKSNINNSLKIYDLTLAYKPDDNTTFWLGRHLNNKVGNIGATDGLQAERQFGDFYGGLIIGSRPNFSDYSYNVKLFEYGGYVGLSNKSNDSFVENVMGVFQQTNDMKVDRRFLYFQHTNNLIPKTNFFLSTEVDLYKKDNDVGVSTFSLTSLYLSLRVAPSRFISFTTTYDARRNVIYYESYRFLIDTLFQNALRQGLRFSANLRPANDLFLGLNGGYQFRSGDIKPSKNYGGYLSYSNVPFLDLTPSLNYTRIISSYVDGTDFGGRLSKYLSGNIDFSIGYRKVTYEFSSASDKVQQNIFTTDISYLIIKNLSLSISYEGVFETANTFSRFFIDLTTRF